MTNITDCWISTFQEWQEKEDPPDSEFFETCLREFEIPGDVEFSIGRVLMVCRNEKRVLKI